MQISVRLFAGAREAVGTNVLTLELPDGMTIAEVGAELARGFPALARWVAISRWAVDLEYVANDTPLSTGQELAMLPPVSGGGA